MDTFDAVYRGLNAAQRQAVDTIEGPLLVVAGPGTGKTQLLSARVAHILRTTDTLPSNILCLTFTESGAANMRERLSQFIGRDAYDVTISTYHAFGGDLLTRYSEYFVTDKTLQPIDTLKKHQIVESIVEQLPYSDRLKQTRHHIKDLMATISEMKRALLTPADIRALATENGDFIRAANPLIADIFNGTKYMPRTLAKAEPLFARLATGLRDIVASTQVNARYGSLAELASVSLDQALTQAEADNSTKPLTAWKNEWLAKNACDEYTLDCVLKNERLMSLAGVLETYESELEKNGFYDFDDMILRAIDGLKTHDELRYTLQEKYLYILLDEYQDTNAAQAELVSQLTDNPVNEGRPNIMAVGDDDQAIYAFQGALFSNMLDFYMRYRDTGVINLSENYRSHGDVLTLAENIAAQIDQRLFHKFPGATKTLTASNASLTTSHLERRDFLSQPAEFGWVAQQIQSLIASGTDPSDIAVLTRKHATLETFVPYLAHLEIPVRYEKRENILEAPEIDQLLTMSRLVMAIGHSERTADALWPTVLSYDFFSIDVTEIWKVSWTVADARDERSAWTKVLLEHTNPALREIAEFFVALSLRASSESCETILDYLIGTSQVPGVEYVSPYRDYYMAQAPAGIYTALTHLTVLRTRVRDYQKSADHMLKLSDMLALVDAYESAEERMLNSNPYSEAESSVQLMTVYKAKGLEFQHVFLLSMTDQLWGSSGRDNSNKLTLPANLAPTRHGGDNEDERLRRLFVAVTRAKTHLYMTSYLYEFGGKHTTRLKYLDERESSDDTYESHVMPAHAMTVQHNGEQGVTQELLQSNWIARHIPTGDVQMKELLDARLEKYQLSPTHLNSFCDMVYGGPLTFYVNTLLRFPSAPTSDGQFGNAVHETLEWLQLRTINDGIVPSIAATQKIFAEKLQAKNLPTEETERLLDRGQSALEYYLRARSDIFLRTARSEQNFRGEGVFIGAAHMAGKIDRIEIDHDTKTIVVVDYKTGKPHARWESDAKLHKYKQQLYCYKLLIEKSASYKGYVVECGRLEFIEPDETGEIHALELNFSAAETARTEQLIEAMWTHVKALDFPDTSEYPASIKGIRQFEDWLLGIDPA